MKDDNWQILVCSLLAIRKQTWNIFRAVLKALFSEAEMKERSRSWGGEQFLNLIVFRCYSCLQHQTKAVKLGSSSELLKGMKNESFALACAGLLVSYSYSLSKFSQWNWNSGTEPEFGETLFRSFRHSLSLQQKTNVSSLDLHIIAVPTFKSLSWFFRKLGINCKFETFSVEAETLKAEEDWR